MSRYKLPTLPHTLVAAGLKLGALSRPKPDVTGLHTFQGLGSNWLWSRETGGILADDMRLGKTAQYLRFLPKLARVIVVCPAIVVLVWREEVLKWRRDLLPTVSERIRRPNEGEIIIVSYDSLPDPREGWRTRLIADDLSDVYLAIDEAHYVCHATAQRTQKVRLLRKQCKRADGLTGTPMPDRPDDLWGLLVTLGLDRICTRREYLAAFKDESCTDEMREKLRTVMLRRTLREVDPELPPLIPQEVVVPFSPSLKSDLDRLYAEWKIADFNDMPPIGGSSTVRKKLAIDRTPHAIALAKEALIAGEPILVFCCHVEPIEAMGAIARSAVIVGTTPDAERDRARRAFQRGELDLLAMTTDTAGVGIKLSRANRLIAIDQDWTPAVNDQAWARPIELGKRRGIHALIMTSDHPLDRRVLAILDRKRRVIDSALAPR